MVAQIERQIPIDRARTRLLHLLLLAVMVAFAVTFALSLLVPILNDEVGWKIITTRFLHDGGRMISLFPRCGANFVAEPPWFMVPMRLIEAGVYAQLSLLQIRVMGVLSFALWLGLTLALLARIVGPVLPGLRLPAVLLGLVSLGALPFLLVINRPEQPLLLGLSLLLLVPLTLPAVRPRWTDAAGAAGVLVVAMGLFASHPKSLLFLPLMLASLFVMTRPWPLRVAAGAGLALMAAQTYGFWTHFNACPGDPAFGHFLAQQMVTLGGLAGDPAGTLRQMIANLMHLPYYGHALKVPVDLPLPWLPPFPAIPDPLADAVTLAIRLVVAGGMMVACVALALRLRTAWRARRLDARLLLVLACGLSLLGLASLQTVRHFYELGLIGPLAILAALVALIRPPSPGAAKAAHAYMAALLAVSLISQIVLWAAVLSRSVGYYTAGGYLPEQAEVSVSPYRYAVQERKIRAAARACAIDIDRRPLHLVTDDLTYPSLAGSRAPFNIFYIVRGSRWPEARLNGAELTAFLRQWRSDGLVAGCHMLPPDLRAGAVRVDDVCCMPAFSGQAPGMAVER